MLNEATKKTQESSIASEIAQLFEKTTNMESKATELEEWHIIFDADQQKQFCEQEKKMTKKLDTQSNQLDNKIDSLVTSVKQHLTTNQFNTQQLLKEQRDYLD
eukprot:6403015-Ditylum_brightwellii.AAC.1